MINKHIFWKHTKSNLFIGLALMLTPAALLCLMLILNPSAGILNALPTMFSTIAFELPLIFIIICGNRILSGEISSGSITYVVTSSISRTQIIITKLIFMFCCVTISFILDILFAIPVIFAKYNNVPGVTDDITISQLAGNISLGLLQNYAMLLVGSGIVMFFSAYSSKLSLSYIFGAGITGGFWLIFIFGSFSKDLHFLQYISINKLADSNNLFGLVPTYPGSSDKTVSLVKPLQQASHWLPELIVLFILAAGLNVGAVYAFKLRDLPL